MPSKREKRQIDRVRDGALSMQVGNDADGSVSQMVTIKNAGMYIIKTHAIYQVVLADDIDPERTNIGIPNGNQKIASQGSDSDIVARSFLTADTLFNSNQFGGTCDLKHVMGLSIAIMKELLAAQKIESGFIEEQSKALQAFEQPRQRSVEIPSIDGLSESFKAFVQRTEHATQGIYKFSQQFYEHTKRLWDGFESKINEEYGDEDEFSKFASSIKPFMIFVRNLRHSIEHPDEHKYLVIKDFAITPDGTLKNPTVELVHPISAQPEMNIDDFLQLVSNRVLDVFEALMVYIASKHIRPFGAAERAVGLLPPDQLRPHSKVRASYFVWLNDGWQKLG